MILLIIGLILFIGLVVVHELGHFITARRNGVVAEEFGIFFPPRLWSRRMKGGWVFSINALPLGGFVKMKGEHDTDTEPGSFGAASLWAKTKIMAAGVVMNLITALILLTALAWLGMPKLVPNQFTVKSDTQVVRNDIIISDIEPNSPAAKAGLKVDDKLLAIKPLGASNEDKINSSEALPAATKKFAGDRVIVTYERHGDVKTVTTTLRTAKEVDASQKTSNPKGYLGVYPTTFTLRRSTWSAPVVAIGLTGQFTALTFEGLGKAVAGLGGIVAGAVTGNGQARHNAQTQASSQVSGPVGIFFVLKQGGVLGYQYMLLIIAIISLTLAIMNILPIPALDGGRLWLMLITRGLNHPLTQEREELINGLGFLFLMTLVVLITVVDVKRFF